MITTNLETLKQVSEPFSGTEEELQALYDILEHDLGTHEVIGSGLSGIQINIPYRVAVIRIVKTIKKHGEEEKVLKCYNLYNAEITTKSQPFTFKGEGCLSLPGEFEDTLRYNQITVENGDGEILNFSGFEAVVVQHEMDHWQGILFTDRIKEG